MGQTLREIIRETTNQHLDAGYAVAGQALTAVGWVGGTLPQRNDMVELPVSDVAGPGFVVGMSLAGKRPIFICRYAGFMWLNGSAIINYAAKSKALWNRPCPLLIRAVSNEGSIGPVAGSSHHSLFLRMPGIKIFSPMTPFEWKLAYIEFMGGDDPVYLSEHRAAWGNEYELKDYRPDNPDIVLFPISITRFAAALASTELFAEDGLKVAIHHVFQIKPFTPSTGAQEDLRKAWFGGFVRDDDYVDGTAKPLALDLHLLTGARMNVLGLDNRTAGFAARVDVLPPDKDKIKAKIREIIQTKRQSQRDNFTPLNQHIKQDDGPFY